MNTNPNEMQVISVPDGSIRDYVDGKFRKDTPEEYVRQTIEKRLINEHKYKREQIKIEFGLKLGSRKPRADIVVFPKDSPEMTQDQVWLIVECKKESVEPRNRKDGVDQLKSYMSACPNCEWGMWTNGKYKVKVENAVTTYFSEPKFAKFSVVRECEIQIGPSSYKADIVLRDEEGNFITIAECKSQRGPNHRPEPLKSYLCATDTSYGIFAPSTNRDSWIFYENLRHNRFRRIERSDFEKGVLDQVEDE